MLNSFVKGHSLAPLSLETRFTKKRGSLCLQKTELSAKCKYIETAANSLLIFGRLVVEDSSNIIPLLYDH